MRIEILTVRGCPHIDATRDLVADVLSSERIGATIDVIEVQSTEAAAQLRFLGSPSVRIEGEDAEPAARNRSEYGLMCRTYSGEGITSGMPPMELIRAAVRKASRHRSESRDLLRRPRTVVAMYWLPAAGIVASGFITMSSNWRGALWATALATMGSVCIMNARQCHRVHCYATGPFLLAGAIAALLYGFGIVSFGEYGWNVLGLALLAGALILYYVSERMFGTYKPESV